MAGRQPNAAQRVAPLIEHLGNTYPNATFDQASGMIVDTHVERVARRLGLSTQKKADKIEQDLMQITPREKWTFFGPALVLHGRYVCKAKKPRCSLCVLLDLCPQIDVKT